MMINLCHYIDYQFQSKKQKTTNLVVGKWIDLFQVCELNLFLQIVHFWYSLKVLEKLWQKQPLEAFYEKRCYSEKFPKIHKKITEP